METKIDIMPALVVKYRRHGRKHGGKEAFYLVFKAPNSEYHRGLSDETFDTEEEAIKALEEHRLGRAVFKAVRVHVGSSFFICSRKKEIKQS